MARELEMPRVEVTHPERKAGGANGKQTPPSQEEAIQQIVRAYQTYLAGLSPVGRPLANFLFLGPTDSGKMRIVVATAESLLQNSRAVIKIDCAEF
jgi:ATP-dependent Clp protease ATP-binding subunit ClpA